MEESKAEKMGNGENGTLATHQKSKKARKIACCYHARTGTKTPPSSGKRPGQVR